MKTLPVYVKQLMECPRATNMFIYLHAGVDDQYSLLPVADKALTFAGIDRSKRPLSVMPLSSVYKVGISGGEFTVSFIVIHQIASHLNDKNQLYVDLIRSTIIEGIYHSTSMGGDTFSHGAATSVLFVNQARIEIKKPEASHFFAAELDSPEVKLYFSDVLKVKSIGLCGYDIWLYILANISEKAGMVYMDDFVKMFKKNNKKIKTRALKITEKYKDLFDPRCNVENTGTFYTNSKGQ